MSERSFLFEPKALKQERTLGKKQISFTYHISYNLKDGDTITICSDYAVIKRVDTQKLGLYDALTGCPILADVYDSIEVKQYDPSGNKHNQLCQKQVTYYEVSVNGLYGAYGEFGQQKVPICYGKGITMQDGFFIVRSASTELYGVYNESGKQIIPEEFTRIDIRYGLIVASIESFLEKKMYAFECSGKFIFKQQFKDTIKGFETIDVYKNLIAYKEDGLYTVCDKSGKPVCNKKFRCVNFHENYFIVQAEDGLWGLYSNDGKELIEPWLRKMSKFDDKYVKGQSAVSEYLFYYNGEPVLSEGMFRNIIKTSYGAMATHIESGKRVKLVFEKTKYKMYV